MGKVLIVVLLGVFSLIGCSKSNVCNFNDSSVVAPANEVQSVQNYLDTSHQTATASPSGFFYKILNQGSGASIANLCSNVNVSYAGKLVNGTVFDQTAPGEVRSFPLGQLVVGWQKALPLLNKGGSMRLYLPPSLAYGPSGNGPVPPNAITIFDITLVDIN